MKFLWTLLFLACGCLAIYISAKWQKFVFGQLRGETGAILKAYLLSTCFLLAGFVQYWSLTRVFPLSLILLLIGSSLATWMISTLLGAIAGLSTQEKREKINVLTVIWTFERGVRNPRLTAWVYILLPSLVILVGWLLSLWAFWRWPIGDQQAKVWIAIFQFTLPQAVSVLVQLGLIWPIVTSEFLDNDVRNSNLIARFSGISLSTVSLLFPVWMLKQEMQTAFGSLPPFWALLSVPLMLFVLGTVFPHFIGMWRSRSKTTSLLAWRKRWLQFLFEVIKLPEGDTRSAAIDQRVRALKDGIEERATMNSLIELYRDVLDVDSPFEEEPHPKALPSPAEAQTSVEAPKPLESALARGYSKAWPVKPHPRTTQEEVLSIVKENKQRLVEWDVRFADLQEMIFLYDVSRDAKTKDLSGFLKAQMKRIDEELAGLNKAGSFLPKALPSALTALVSSILVALLKAYDGEIVELVTGLLGGSA